MASSLLFLLFFEILACTALAVFITDLEEQARVWEAGLYADKKCLESRLHDRLGLKLSKEA
jgi:hypothetical protein